ncbi:hypothetical protein ACQBAT_00430 [Ornithinimicrobium sp. Y1847]|uniref:hypothetical protein n=1 Tax=Ornithinimicrobium sp. Y1847 TaxID=3405419 RepID=UPI003D02463A
MTSIFTIFTLLIITGLAVATNSSQSNQNAADAAALAAADAFDTAGAHYFAPGFSGSAELRGRVLTSGACPSQVRAAAATYASKNGSRLTSCRMLKWGEVSVSVDRDVPVEGAGRGRATARAHWDLTWESCFVDPAFVAPVTGAGFTWMQCGKDRFDLKYAGGRYFLHPWGQVKKAINPRLTG